MRKALSEAIGGGGEESDAGSDESSSEANMDDEQMMAIDEKLAEVFRSQQLERKKGKGMSVLNTRSTYFLLYISKTLEHSARQHISRTACST